MAIFPNIYLQFQILNIQVVYNIEVLVYFKIYWIGELDKENLPPYSLNVRCPECAGMI